MDSAKDLLTQFLYWYQEAEAKLKTRTAEGVVIAYLEHRPELKDTRVIPDFTAGPGTLRVFPPDDSVHIPRAFWDRFGAMMQNSIGEWVPAIPMPIQLSLGRFRCNYRSERPIGEGQLTTQCSEKFWKLEDYQGHYAYKHILLGE